MCRRGVAALAGVTVTASSASATSAATAPGISSPALASVAVLAESPCPYSSGHPNLYYTDTGSAVRHAQCLINLYGYGIAEDGIYGASTRTAVKSLQSRCGITVDGMVGANTWNCLHPDKSPNPR
ncbi:peptidoglycan-binding domain-containing protein [Embleya sp. MST-111070]|uniref:peptidoglycan-binding domain-containing protein n=1 Tax=Embleya sp. MST-111070 TaxID=3398231 RepID=UPI003F737018